MGKNIFIAGKELPGVAGFAEGFVLKENNVVLALSAEPEDSGMSADSGVSGVKKIEWRRGSGVAARSAVIQAESEIGFIDDFILYYDSAFYSSVFDEFSTEYCAKACDSLVSSFQFLALEIMARVKQHKSRSRIVFALKAQPSVKDVILSPNLKSLVQNPSNAFVAAGEAAFATFAENVAAVSAEDENLSVLLVAGDDQNEVMRNDSSFSSWLNGYISACDELKNKPSAKNSASWVKAGSKNPGGFSLFK